MTEQNEPTKCPRCGSDDRNKPKILPHPTEDAYCFDPWHRQPAAPETAEPSTLISDSRIKHSPLFCGSRYCAQHRDIWHHFETVISRDSAAPPEGETMQIFGYPKQAICKDCRKVISWEDGNEAIQMPGHWVHLNLTDAEACPIGGDNFPQPIQGAVASSAMSAEQWWNDNSYRYIDKDNWWDMDVVLEAYAAARLAERDAEVARLKRELEHFEKSCIVEVAVRNPQVAEYVKHWEGRAEAAEARVAELEAALEDAHKLVLLLRCDADLKEGCTPETAQLEGQFMRGEKLSMERARAALTSTK